jgi:hypothetical protein
MVYLTNSHRLKLMLFPRPVYWVLRPAAGRCGVLEQRSRHIAEGGLAQHTAVETARLKECQIGDE